MDGAVGVRVERGVPRASLDGVATREPVKNSVNFLADDRGGLALVSDGGRSNGEELASLGYTIPSLIIRVVALIDSILKGIGFPTVLEVRVPGVASRVAGGVDERPLVSSRPPATSKRVNIPGDLVEQLQEIDGVSGWARTIIQAGEVGGVGGVIGGVDILAIPACRHVDTCVKARLAIGGREA